MASKTINPSWAKRNGAPVQPGETGPKNGGEGDFSYENILPWLMAGGLGLIGHSVAAPFFDDDENKKQSVWRKLLGTLIPLGVGGLGAYGGYALGKSLMNKSGAAGDTADTAAKAVDKIGPDTKVKFTYGGKNYVLPNKYGPWVDNVEEYGNENGMPQELSSLEDTATDYLNSSDNWSNLYGGAASLFGLGSIVPAMKGLADAPWLKAIGNWRSVAKSPRVPIRGGGWQAAVKGIASNAKSAVIDKARQAASAARAINLKNSKSLKYAGLMDLIAAGLTIPYWWENRKFRRNREGLNALKINNPEMFK